jgi:hypothetical protein
MVGQDGKQHRFRAIGTERAVMVTDGDKTAERRAENGNCQHPQAVVSKGSRLRENRFYYDSPTIRSASEGPSLLTNMRMLNAAYPQR